jgi:hypothetical protein
MQQVTQYSIAAVGRCSNWPECRQIEVLDIKFIALMPVHQAQTVFNLKFIDLEARVVHCQRTRLRRRGLVLIRPASCRLPTSLPVDPCAWLLEADRTRSPLRAQEAHATTKAAWRCRGHRRRVDSVDAHDRGCIALEEEPFCMQALAVLWPCLAICLDLQVDTEMFPEPMFRSLDALTHHGEL